MLYRWCRYCDDQIDQASSKEQALSALAEVSYHTRSALQNPAKEDKFKDFGQLCQSYQIPSEYPLELLNGFKKDVLGVTYKSLEDVEDYSYQVAGVVGLMMTHIMGSRDPQALVHAKSLGIAMQLTNIARDVAEDYELGRIYLPREWLLDARVNPNELLKESQNRQVFEVVGRLLDRAEYHYNIGLAGLKYLPVRAALAVGIAARIYRAIGRKRMRKGHSALTQRMRVSLAEKWLLTFQSSLCFLVDLKARRLVRSTSEIH